MRGFNQESVVHGAFYSHSFGLGTEDRLHVRERDHFRGNHHITEQRQSDSEYVKVRFDFSITPFLTGEWRRPLEI